jgi:[methyl-Co(III) methanol-specific corrinoid protein]:coenzyme M methyltransferase
MAESEADGITIHHLVDMGEANKALAGRSASVGNLGPRALAVLPPDALSTASRRCLNQGVDILAPSCGLDPSTPLESLRSMAEAARRFGQSRGPKS